MAIWNWAGLCRVPREAPAFLTKISNLYYEHIMIVNDASGLVVS